jgi:hypothetical protein
MHNAITAITMPHQLSSTLSEEDDDATSCYYGIYEGKGHIIALIRCRVYLDVIAILIG